MSRAEQDGCVAVRGAKPVILAAGAMSRDYRAAPRRGLSGRGPAASHNTLLKTVLALVQNYGVIWKENVQGCLLKMMFDENDHSIVGKSK